MTTKSEDIREYYDTFADVYDTKHGVTLQGQAYNFRRHYAPFLEAELPRSGRALELGCGTGVYTRFLSDRGLDVTAMDISTKMIEGARRRAPKAAFFAGDCEDPATAVGAEAVGDGFDVILGVNTFSYYAHKRQALANYNKILCPNGRFVVIDMNGASPYYGLMSKMNKNEMKQWLPEIQESSRKVLLPWFAETGFEVKRFEHFAFVPNGLGGTAVTLLSPFDALFSALPGFGWMAMRVAYTVVKTRDV